MLVTFSTDAYANITLFGDVATELLHKMGHSGTIPGAIVSSDVGTALQKLKQAIATDDSDDQPNAVQASTYSGQESDGEDQQAEVSLKNRALPLIDLLSAAAAKQRDVMWK